MSVPPEPPVQSPLASEVISAALQQDITEADVLVRCPTCAKTVPMHIANVTLTENGSDYTCPKCRPATLLLQVERRGPARWDVDAPYGYGLAIKPAVHPRRRAT